MAMKEQAFPPLPGAGRDGPRLCGVELEFAGLTEARVAEIVRDTLGGDVEPDGPHAYRIDDTRIGTIKVELDTALRKKDLPMLETGLDLARAVVPVEIVSAPLDGAGLIELDRLRDRLRAEGAHGSRGGLFLGFGVHLNPELPADPDRVLPIIRAYGLLEDWLRDRDPIDATRRVLPFVDPWPHRLVDDLVAQERCDLPSLMRLYAARTTSRNHGLDLLPIFKDADPEGFAEAFPRDTATSGRPAFHYRLPDCRIDEPGWTLSHPWRSWLIVERLAQDTTRLGRLAEAWNAYRTRMLTSRSGWAEQVADLLGSSAEPPA